MPTAVIVDAVRSPMANGRAHKADKPGGALSLSIRSTFWPRYLRRSSSATIWIRLPSTT